MIYRIYSDLPTFKNLELRSGLNILLSIKSPEATDKHTRNRAGKTSLIEIIHFLTGADVNPDSLFKKGELVLQSFGMEFDLQGERVIVERSGITSGDIKIIDPIPQNLPLKPKLDTKLGGATFSNTEWKTVLGKLIFNLPPDSKKRFGPYAPTFRSLFAYFVRRQKSDAFISAFLQSKDQKLWDQQVAISYLLGLDWTISQQWESVRDKENTLAQLKRAAKKGSLGKVVGNTAHLRTSLAVAEKTVRRLKNNLEKFQVLPEYRELEQEASKIVRQQGKLSNDNVIDNQLLDELIQAIEHETEPALGKLERLYAEVGVILPNTIIKRFEEVQIFHKSIVENRHLYLQGEIDEAKKRIEIRDRERFILNARHKEIMDILNSHGALDQYNQLNSELSRLEAESSTIRQEFILAERLESQIAELDAERSQLLLRLQQDYKEQSELLTEVIVTFEEISASLYENSGSLTIAPSRNGPKFDIHIQGGNSIGISSMQIFCFDMMLMQVAAKNHLNPGFLVHDSRLFDGVDSRQIMKALEVGAYLAEKYNFQYIVTLNSDVVAEQISSNFSIDDYLLPVNLTDATEDGGLFGIRF